MLKSALALVLLLAAAPASAADAAKAGATVPTVPGDEIFGFTTATDPGNPGDVILFNENDGRFGKRQGSYFALDQKLALGYTFAPDWWIGGGLFDAINQTSGVAGLPDVSQLRFDGASIELEHRVISRTATNPFAVSLDVEPRWGRVDGVTGLPSQNFGATFKMFVDAPITPDKFYWAGNILATFQNAQVPGNTSQWSPSSQLELSTALTWKVSDTLFVGAEARYFSLSDNSKFSHEIGRALYVGPTLWWKITDKIAFNTTLQPQIYGRSAASPGQALDLDDFERAQFRAKFVVSF